VVVLTTKEKQMSRKYLDDGIQLAMNSLSDLPSQDNEYYGSGHEAKDEVSGKHFINEGADDRNSSLFVNDQYNALILHEKLELLPTTTAVVAAKNQNLLLVGTNVANTTVGFNTNGGVKLTSTTASADQVILEGASTSAYGLSFPPDNQVVFETQIVTDTSIALVTIFAGLKLTATAVTATDNDQIFFRYQDTVNGGRWQTIDSNTNVDNVQDSGVTVAVSTAYFLQIKVGEDLAPRYYINGVLVATGNPLATGTALKIFEGIQTNTTAAKAATVRHIRVVVGRSPSVRNTEGL
jgi:hypothetical protein